MPLTAEEELQEAIKQWLDARQNFHGEGSNGVGVLSGFMEAHRKLLSAFMHGWSGDDTKLGYSAYHAFLRLLVHNHEHSREARGFSRLT